MLFIQTAFLGALAAIAVPVVIHLMFRTQARKVSLGTLRFLKQVLERNAQRQRIMRWLLLLLRMGAVACLAMLFARPYLLEAAFGGDQKLALVLIDHSASMELKGEAGRLIDQAVNAARQIVTQLPSRTQVEVAIFDETVHPVTDAGNTTGNMTANRPAPPAANRARTESYRDDALQQLARVSQLKESFHATNFGAAMNWARDRVVQSDASQRELHLFTDLQQSGLDWTEIEPLPAGVLVFVHDLGRSGVRNVAVTEARPLRASIRPGENTQIQATIFNSSPFPIAEQPVVLKIQSATGKRTFRERVKLEAGTSAVATFELIGLEAGFWTGTVSLETDDDLAFDNQRSVAIRVQPPERLLLIDGQPHPSGLLSESYFLATALRLAGPNETAADAPFDVTVIDAAESSPWPDFKPFRAVILANVAAVPPDEARRLSAFVQAGGGMIVFGGDQVQSAGYRALQQVGLVPGNIVGPQVSTDLPYRFESWDESHPVLRPFADPQHGDLRRLSFRGYTRIALPDEPTGNASPTTNDANRGSSEADRKTSTENGWSVLARFRGGDPVLLYRRLGAEAANGTGSRAETSAGGQVLWLTTSADRHWSDWTGSRLYLPLMHQLVGQPLGLNEGGPIRSAIIGSPSESEPEIEDQPGVYERNGYRLVVNASPRESETDRSSTEEFARRFEIKLQSHAGETEEEEPADEVSATDLKPHEQWPIAAWSLIGLLLLEAFVANRTVS